ncbi:MAG: AAA family ATPase [Bacilli bacterium]|nr:AAA family ATPase [Bacilli bacterium]
MYLKKLKMVGFKSFINPTEIEFNDRITGVVGPNGSGKSNIVDAVRWVLGEQSVKSLRGEGNMGDVIFSGSKGRKAANYASVELYFDNTDRYLSLETDEVVIKRTVYKSLENEYMINNVKCRLKDITDLFMDTGASKESYNIISQGDIGNILSTKAEDRRIIFEDASGVLKYKKRKEEALRKLSKTNDNLVRVNDIILENEERLNPLKEQSEKAKIYLKDKEELENIEVALVINDIDKYNFVYKESKEKIEELQLKISEMLSKTSHNQANIESIKQRIDNLNRELYEKGQEQARISANVEKYQGEKNLISERSKYESNDTKLHENIVSLKEQLLSLENEINILNKNIEMDNKENGRLSLSLEDISKEITNNEKEKINLVSETNSKIREITLLKNRKESLENEIENNSSLPSSVRNVLNNPKLRGIEGIVGKLFEVEEMYTKMVDVALGNSSSYIVTVNENNAKDAVEYLKNNNLGRATFYPLSVIKSRNVDSDSYNKIKYEDNFVDIASNLLKYDNKYKSIIENLLGNVIVVKDLDSANKISKVINNKYKIVTLDGDVVNPGGSITGGSYKNKNSILTSRYELEEVIKKISKSENDLSIIEDSINVNDEYYAKLDRERKELLVEINSRSELLKERNNKKEELVLRKESIYLELNSNMNTVNNVLSNEEETILNKYYEEKQKQEQIKIEIENILKTLERTKEELQNEETNLKIDNVDYNKYQDELKKNEIQVSKLDVKLDNLLNILNEEYSITYEKAKSNYILDMDEDSARSKVNKLKREIRELGEVNVSSIEEYEKVNERYNFLTTQKEDLLHAKDMLLEIINQMDEVMKEKFIETFKLVQVEFKDTFRKLFGGGDAELKLTDQNNILETGVDIVALPPGKKLQHISLLSGGEKTLTAIALLFAILKIRPVPFCILDEVEAALDEVNVDSFGKYLSEYKDKTEFIIITHKKKTMEYADVLYGITMQESGVSKLVSVKLEEIKK